ncbi:MAG: VOC family protein [Alphaproteobacteria bacterium]|nr:VOC family protein [Alphaproteobacteria bacterium]
MIEHISLGVADVVAVKPFYDAVLATLGYRCLDTTTDPDGSCGGAGYGDGDYPFFWIATPYAGPKPQTPCNGSHFAFSAPSAAAVDAFYQAALAQGGGDGGAPGLRPEYGTHYYAAFVTDPFGHKIEAVYRRG